MSFFTSSPALAPISRSRSRRLFAPTRFLMWSCRISVCICQSPHSDNATLSGSSKVAALPIFSVFLCRIPLTDLALEITFRCLLLPDSISFHSLLFDPHCRIDFQFRLISLTQLCVYWTTRTRSVASHGPVAMTCEVQRFPLWTFFGECCCGSTPLHWFGTPRTPQQRNPTVSMEL